MLLLFFQKTDLCLCFETGINTKVSVKFADDQVETIYGVIMENIKTENLFAMMDVLQRAKSRIQNSSKNSNWGANLENELSSIASEILKRSEFEQ